MQHSQGIDARSAHCEAAQCDKNYPFWAVDLPHQPRLLDTRSPRSVWYFQSGADKPPKASARHTSTARVPTSLGSSIFCLSEIVCYAGLQTVEPVVGDATEPGRYLLVCWAFFPQSASRTGCGCNSPVPRTNGRTVSGRPDDRSWFWNWCRPYAASRCDTPVPELASLHRPWVPWPK